EVDDAIDDRQRGAVLVENAAAVVRGRVLLYGDVVERQVAPVVDAAAVVVDGQFTGVAADEPRVVDRHHGIGGDEDRPRAGDVLAVDVVAVAIDDQRHAR